MKTSRASHSSCKLWSYVTAHLQWQSKYVNSPKCVSSAFYCIHTCSQKSDMTSVSGYYNCTVKAIWLILSVNATPHTNRKHQTAATFVLMFSIICLYLWIYLRKINFYLLHLLKLKYRKNIINLPIYLDLCQNLNAFLLMYWVVFP